MNEPDTNLNQKNSVIVTAVSLHPIRTPRVSGDDSQHVLIRLDTDSGLVGVGEYTDITDLPLTMPDLGDLQKSLSNLLCGQNAMEIARLDHLLSLLFTGRGDTGIYTGSLRAGIEMAGALGLVPIATGVDDPESRDALLTFGCTYGSGDLYQDPQLNINPEFDGPVM